LGGFEQVRILLSSGIFPPQIGGPATYVPQLSKDLEGQGHEVTVVTLGEKDEEAFIGNIKVIKIGRNSFLIMRMIRTTLRLFKESLRSDAVFSNGLFIETACAITFARKRKRSVVKIVGDPVWERARNNGQTSLHLSDFLASSLNSGDRVTRRIYNIAWSAFEFRTAPSEELCNFINAQIHKNDARYIPNGVDIPIESKIEREIDIACVSRLVNWKNVDLVIRAAGESNLSLLIIGDGPEQKKLEDLANKLKVRANFQGQLPPEMVSAWLERSKYFLLLSDYEGLSFALLEAMARGVVPVVSANEGNLSVIESGKNGMVSSISLKEVVECMTYLENNPEVVTSMSLAAVEDVRIKFNGEIQRRKVIDLMLQGQRK
jgi:glycosyltransferase involved in cell wall biosynthesis